MTTRREHLETTLRQLEELAAEAREAERWTAAVQAAKAALAVREQLAELEEAERASGAAPETLAEHRAEALRTVRELRIQAIAKGSFTAAARLIELEIDLLGVAESEERQARADQLAKMTPEALRAEIERLRRARER